MSLHVIIISQNQKEWISPFKSFLDRNLPDCPALIVLDRCTDGSESEAARVGLRHIKNHDGTGFMAGTMRNLGLSVMGAQDTLFLDGDRVPGEALDAPAAQQALSMFDITLFPLADEHEPRKWFHDTEFITNPNFGLINNGVYSCGMLMRAQAIQAIVDYQGGPLFHPRFAGIYGTDDPYLGDVAYRLGLSCGCAPKSMALSGQGFRSPEQRGPGYKRGVMTRHRLRKVLFNHEEVKPND